MKFHRCLIVMLLTVSSFSGRAQLLISEYIDASTTRCGIELWNVSGTNITFGPGPGQMDVRLEIYANGSVAPTATIALSPGAIVQAGTVFILAHSLATFAPIADQTAGLVSWTGDDAIVVRLAAGTVLDSLGQVGVDPGTEWGTGSASTADNTLRRKAGNFIADTDPFNAYDPAAYFDGYPVDNTEDLGLPPSANVLPYVATFPPSDIGGNQATFRGEVNSSNTSTMIWFQYGTSTNYGSATPAQMAGSGIHGFVYTVTGLVAGVAYHYRAVASNSLGAVFGSNQSFTILFTVVTNLTGVYKGLSAWGDYDGDGWLDVLLAGSTNNFSSGAGRSHYSAELWRNTGSGFNKVSGAWFNYIEGSTAAWSDFDNDGDLDATVNVIGFSYDPQRFTDVTTSRLQTFQNSNSFFLLYTNVPSESQNDYDGTAHLRRQRAWSDFDNDGRLDFASRWAWSSTVGGYAVIPGPFDFETLASSDYDNDGRSDLAGLSPGGNVWQSTVDGFTNRFAALPRLNNGSVAWGDYDNDGFPDLLVTGQSNLTQILPVTEVWRNTSGTGFTKVNFALPGVWNGNAAWGDYDNDGRLDIFLTGQTNLDVANVLGTAQLWRNTGSGFSNVFSLTPVAFSCVAWADYDNDGRLDVLLTGSTNGSYTGATSQIWRNATPQANTPPTVPSGLSASVTDNILTFSWNASSDVQTPSQVLTYNLRVGTATGTGNVVVPMARGDGRLLLPQHGNRHRTRTWSISMTNFLGQPIYWSVQAIDSSFGASAFAPEASFRLVPAIVPVNVTNVSNLASGDLNNDGVVSQVELDAVLANYWPNSPWLFMTNAAGLGGSNVTFALSNSTAGAFSVEYSTNLADWSLLGPATPRYEFQDTNAPAQPQRYYRLRWP